MKLEKAFDNILVVGLGLVGGSILKSLKYYSFGGDVYGLDSDHKIITKAHKLGLIKNQDTKITHELKKTLVIFSIPTLSINKAIKELKRYSNLIDPLFTDTCSVKSSVLESLKKENPELLSNFVLSHPIAGSEKNGLASSLPNLFEKKLTIICPHKDNRDSDLKKVECFWNELKSLTKRVPSDYHDDIFAKTSHLPHVISFTLMDALFKNLGVKTFLYSGGSLEDYTRIASSDPLMWKDIMMANEKHIIESIEMFKDSLERLLFLIKDKDDKELLSFFSSVKKSRDSLL
ncbi:MAG: prephenate dehydrogenase/arogenate dehydrogenase family protein [SAR86 cluster bacterium]|nr:prephenate dehydrogenase/arogenate dehydrogenase family protein [SAR86 cluster bacterium]